MLSRDQLAELATAVYGSEWQSALARERGVAVRTVQRWAKDGIGKPETAIGIQAYLLSRRVVNLPPPLSDDQDQRDDSAGDVAAVLLADLVGAGVSVGWHEAEVLGGFLGAVVDRMASGAGVPATIETLRDVLKQIAQRVDR